MDQTIDVLVEASYLPISIIIIGVGNANFDKMNILDGDGQLLRSSRGVPAARDIVQFVPFRQFAQSGPAELSAEVLRELPRQVTEFFSRVGKVPNKPIEININQMMQIQHGIGGGLLGMTGKGPAKQFLPPPDVNAMNAPPMNLPPAYDPNMPQPFDQMTQGHTGNAPIHVMIPTQPGDPNFVLPPPQQQNGQNPNYGGQPQGQPGQPSEPLKTQFTF